MAPSSISRNRKAVLCARWSVTVTPSVVAMAMRVGLMKAYGNTPRRLSEVAKKEDYGPPMNADERSLKDLDYRR